MKKEAWGESSGNSLQYPLTSGGANTSDTHEKSISLSEPV